MKGRLALSTLAVVFLVAASVVGGCADASQGGDPPLTGVQLIEMKCDSCHGIERIDAVTYDLAGWETTIDRMCSKGADVSRAEEAVIAEYLANR
ncbi:MAG TPA: hypothetical protein VFE45_13295 [Coriobacteriia bacterium]|nr:hypothetical protein [Coriobacteriia bacterium]